jgi:queuine tRNA-ribosyltransferase
MSFELLAGGADCARAGVLHTDRGSVETPLFMPVGTLGSVKGIAPTELRRLGARIILGNTYHLLLRPGVDIVQELGGLHRFTRWDGPILTDSGGFQVFSLGHLRSVDDHGVVFRSHIDGSALRMTPESAIAAQEALGSDIIMAFDEPPGPDGDRDRAAVATNRTHAWLVRCFKAHEGFGSLFPICQGGMYPDLRKESAAFASSLEADGYAVGGLGLGESKETTWRMLEASIERLPTDRPRYVMGIGAPDDLLNCVARGVDMFDCVLPTRLGRNGAVFTSDGKLNLRNASLKRRDEPVETGCDCEACAEFSLAYLHHLFHCEELLGYRLASIHNLRFLVRLMERARLAILAGDFDSLRAEFLSRYRAPDESVRNEQRRRWSAAHARWSANACADGSAARHQEAATAEDVGSMGVEGS